MKLTLWATAALASTVAAQDQQYYNISSSPFQLVLKSDNATLHLTVLGACHQGAAIEGLCFTGRGINETATPYTTFYYNISSYSSTNSFYDNDGLLGWNLNTTSLLVPSAMRLSKSPTSNVANAVFSPGWSDPSLVSFDAAGYLYIKATQNDLVDPVGYWDPPLHVKNWYICSTLWSSYRYDTLIWKIGLQGQPQNPACQYVEVFKMYT
ncbi:hypothetical protein ACEQ8H_003270 [Pleosporales sp. CAS-2024a]